MGAGARTVRKSLLAAQPGTDGALAMAMGHVILKEFFVDRATPYFADYVKKYTDLPFLVALDEVSGEPGTFAPGRFLTAADLGGEYAQAENPEFRTVLLDAATGRPVVPKGTLGDRYGESGAGKWNLDLGDTRPLLSAEGGDEAPVAVVLPRFDAPDGSAARLRRGVPVRRVAGRPSSPTRPRCPTPRCCSPCTPSALCCFSRPGRSPGSSTCSPHRWAT
jgi:nitrate reductase alpha subunit